VAAAAAAASEGARRSRRRRGKPIDELVEPGDYLLVQITRGPLGNKGPALTTRISLPGRYVVLLANSRRSGVSRRIDSGAERDRMRSIVSGLDLPQGMAVILRTASHGRTRAEVQADVSGLVGLWKTLEGRLHETGGPRLVHAESDLVMRAIRDILPADATRVVVDDEAAAARVEELLRRMTPPPVEPSPEPETAGEGEPASGVASGSVAPEAGPDSPGAPDGEASEEESEAEALAAVADEASPPIVSGAASTSGIGPEADPDDDAPESSAGGDAASGASASAEGAPEGRRRGRRSRRDRRARREAPAAWTPPRVERHVGPGPMFHAFGVESQVEDAYRRTIRLPSGGSIVIDPTEALVAIDVNSGRLTEEEDLESTAWKTDLEAVPEVSRQLRLRDLGGVIVIDFIDLREPSHVHEVERALREALKRDRARIRLGRMGPFGCLELTRQRIRPALASVTHVGCTACGGTGRRRHPMGLALRVLREIRARIARTRGQGGLEVRAAPPVVELLRKRKADALSDIERALAGPLRLLPDPTLGQAGWAMKGIPPKPAPGSEGPERGRGPDAPERGRGAAGPERTRGPVAPPRVSS